MYVSITSAACRYSIIVLIRGLEACGNERGGQWNKSNLAIRASAFPAKVRFRFGSSTLAVTVTAARYLCIRAEPPFANARTWSTVAIVVSPGKVVRSAPCAQPSFTASSGASPVSKP